MEKDVIQFGESEQTMSSLEIAEVTGKPHSDVLKAIRKMEPSWAKVAEGNFSLGSYSDKNGQDRPCYYLTRRECLYIATKFNDEARAKLVLRWEALETGKAKPVADQYDVPKSFSEALMLAARQQQQIEQQQKLIEVKDAEIVQKVAVIEAKDAVIGEKEETIAKQDEVIKVQAPRVKYTDDVLQSGSTMNTTQVAKTYGMTGEELNRKLRDAGIQYKQGDMWLLKVPYARWNLTKTRTHPFMGSDGTQRTNTYTVWNERGRFFIDALHRNDFDVKAAISYIKGQRTATGGQFVEPDDSPFRNMAPAAAPTAAQPGF